MLRPCDLFTLDDVLPQYTRYIPGFEHLLLRLCAGRGEEAMLIKFGARFDTGSREYPEVACRDLHMLGASRTIWSPGD